MIHTTLGQLVNADKALGELAKQRLPANVAYQVAKMLKAAADEIGHFTTQKNALITELGVEKDGQVGITPESAHWPSFLTRLNEVASVEVELPVSPVSIDVLGEMTAADLVLLGPLVDGGEPVATEKPRTKLKSVKSA